MDMNSPEIKHKQGFAIGASATASARVSLGIIEAAFRLRALEHLDL